ncbi:uncharacterized protein LOC143553226 [Bidens hawaiensis]|uniref:uncharacterized protein LOC143553226 n=1 Tax=Bidens hawaiensis TaxID=980011 RepID=UPI00404AD867
MVRSHLPETVESAMELAGYIINSMIRNQEEEKERDKEAKKPKSSEKLEKEESTPKSACKTCGKKHTGKCRLENSNNFAYCKRAGHTIDECRKKLRMDRDDWMYKALRQSEIYAEEAHLFENGFKPRYHCWSRHGESLADFSTSSTTIDNTYNNDSLNLNGDDEKSNDPIDDDNHSNDPNENVNEMLHDMETDMGDAEIENLQHLFEDAEKPLYPGSNFKKLDTVLNLLNLKLKNGWSDKSFTELLVFWHERLPRDNELPISTYQAKKLMCPMGLEVERIHACPNNCILYRNQYENNHKCVVCGASRYKQINDSGDVDDEMTKKRPPAKVLWYLPIIPRLKRHVADSPQWKTIDNKYREFGKEARNIRFGLSSDGISPFGTMSRRHSTWPVLLCIYNLPQWLCMKRKYIMMSLLIQGPRQPGNNIDVYLSPLIDDLKTLWDSGVKAYDAYKKEHFQLRAMIFCTINDFPAYGNLSGYKVKGKKACPEKDIYVTLCELEMYFPPSFFDIMVHLIAHIVQEIKACGPVYLRYMYPFERYMGVLKGHVRNRNRPEGSIIEGLYGGCRQCVGVPKTRHSGRLEGHAVVGLKAIIPNREDVQTAHLVVLKHMACLSPYVNEHMEMLRSTNPNKDDIWYIKTQNKELSRWMRNKVKEIDVDETVKRLGDGPDCRVKSYQGYDINDYTFYTSDRDKKSAVQNSGVTLIASTTELYGQRRETMIKIAKGSYYGVIQEIWELDYHDFKIPLFRCKWVNNRTGVQVDKYRFTLVDLATDGYRSEPFVMAKHVTQVFFVKDPSKPRYHIVFQGKRHILGVDNVVNEEEDDHFDDLPPFSVDIEPSDYENMRHTTYLRDDIDEIYVDEGVSNIKKTSRGIAAFLTKIPEDKLPMRFDENNMPLHDDPEILGKFSSFYGMTVQHCFPIHIQMCQFEDKDFDYVWSETKQFWKIETDTPKEYMRRWAVRLGTNFRSRTATNYIYNPDPSPDAPKAYEKFPFIDEEDWKLKKEKK